MQFNIDVRRESGLSGSISCASPGHCGVTRGDKARWLPPSSMALDRGSLRGALLVLKSALWSKTTPFWGFEVLFFFFGGGAASSLNLPEKHTQPPHANRGA